MLEYGGKSMNDHVEHAVQEFVRAIKETETYQEYMRQRARILQYPNLKEQIDEFREKSFEFQISVRAEEMFDKVDEFQQEYKGLQDNPLVSDFLEAEVAFCRMMQSANIKIVEMLEFG